MGWESIGSVNTGQMPEDGDWIVFALGLARTYVLHVAGKPPPGHTLGICWHDHDLGEYPTLGVHCELSPDMRYVGDCERALERFDAAVEWSAIKPEWAHDEDHAGTVDDDPGYGSSMTADQSDYTPEQQREWARKMLRNKQAIGPMGCITLLLRDAMSDTERRMLDEDYRE